MQSPAPDKRGIHRSDDKDGAAATKARFFFFVVAPFCSCPVSLVSRSFFAVVPGCAKCVFLLLCPVGHRDLAVGPEKQKPGWCFCCSGPAERSRRPTGRNKKHTLHTRGRQQTTILETNDTGHEQKGPQQKNNTDSRTAALDRDAHSLLFRGDFSGRARAGVFFAAAPRGRSLTHCGPGRRCLPPGWCFFLLPDQGGVFFFFFFCCGPAPTLTHSLWAGAISARPGWCFCFWLRPRRTRRANNKKCLVYDIGSKKTRRGHVARGGPKNRIRQEGAKQLQPDLAGYSKGP